ncbi:MAG: DUF2470 domain-containing protein [Pseudomonadota bacterium]
MTDDTPFDSRAVTIDLLRTGLVGCLATCRPHDGAPFASLVTLASDSDGAPLALISTLAVHTQNLLQDSAASILIDRRRDGDPLTQARVSLVGQMRKTEAPSARQRFLAHHPSAALYADFPDFGMYRFEMASAHLVAGFGRIVDLTPSDVLTDLTDAEPLIAAEADIIAHMNEDHRDACDLYAQALAGRDGVGFRCAGVDPSGMTLVREAHGGGDAVHIPFPQPVRAAGILQKVLKQMAETARAARSQ